MAILIVAILTFLVTAALFVYQVRKDKKELIISIIPECIEKTFPNYWFLDIAACGKRSISISSNVKILLSDGEHDLPLIQNNLLIPGGLHCHTERKPCQWLIKKEIESIIVSEQTRKQHKVDIKNLHLLKKIVQDYNQQIKKMKAD